MGWVDNRHRGEVASVLGVHACLIVVGVKYSRRRLWCSLVRHIDEQGVVDRLASWVVGIQCSTHLLFRPQYAVYTLGGVIPGLYAQSDVGGVEGLAQRVGVLSENHIPHVVNQIVLPYLHHGS
jgi:hypothetical protein